MPIALLVIVVIVLLVIARSLRIASEWQRAVILRLGRFHQTKGPGIYLVFPVIDSVAQLIDLRIQTTTITAEQALTRDTVAVGVDAIVFWQVDNAEVGGDPHRQLSRGNRARRADQPARDDRLHRPFSPAVGPQGRGRTVASDDQRKDDELGRDRTQRGDQGRARSRASYRTR